ncbi:surfeit locus 1 family protein [Polaromonas sp. OV174]|uniref:SURF1 family protein n=1 Tax=Polaromonas sp. OV174 TaxID=1855300 RepID=UPI0008E75831|nr:SURF1 family protein [Polaromonas sp. OV174]SFC40147.1 surfeit locus 1 family protein [Polaromonas sp. OV174]
MASRAPRSTFACVALALIAVLLVAGFAALGQWQLERRAWKHALISRVEQRVHAPATALPPPSQWPQISAAGDEYRHLQVSGRFLHDRETLVQAVTAHGSGFWVMTPLQTENGETVLVNRGFIPPEARARQARAATESAGPVSVTGLLRLSEPGGGFLRRNDLAANKWYSRDVAAIAQARGLTQVAPFFLDANATPAPPAGDSTFASPAWPLAGLTVIKFQDHHLIYAITWYTLALMVLGATVLVAREQGRRRRDHMGDNPPHVARDSEDPSLD